MAATSGANGLIDTDILVDAARGLPDTVAFLAAQEAGFGIHISIISSMELVTGCRNAVDLRRAQQFLRRVTVLPVTAAVSQLAYQLMEAFFLGHGLLIPDALIAATALDQNLPLYTRNLRHFQMIPALTLLRPY